MDQHKMKHLELIQGVINRLANCSFLLKGWVITLVAALFVLSDKQADESYFFLAYIPTIIFWGLDGYYLWQERLFRKLYQQVSEMSEEMIDFSMAISKFRTGERWPSAVLSITLIPFYLTLAVAILLVILIT